MSTQKYRLKGTINAVQYLRGKLQREALQRWISGERYYELHKDKSDGSDAVLMYNSIEVVIKPSEYLVIVLDDQGKPSTITVMPAVIFRETYQAVS